MRKAHLFTGLLAAAAALAVGGKASADLILNGDFSLGDIDYSTGYVENSIAQGGNNAGFSGPHGDHSGVYGIVKDSSYWHSSFTDFHDHTTGSGNMMIFNGSEDANTIMWQQVVSGTTVGHTYLLDFYARSAYGDNPADIDITASANALATSFQLSSDTSGWEEFSMSFVSNGDPTTITLVDSVLEADGNDFAIDDISLNAVVPAPASALSGTLLLAGVAIANKLRRRRQA